MTDRKTVETTDEVNFMVIVKDVAENAVGGVLTN